MENVIGIEVGKWLEDGVVGETVQDFEDRWSILTRNFDTVGCCIVQQVLDRESACLKQLVMLFNL